jgi:hypothetical protein
MSSRVSFEFGDRPMWFWLGNVLALGWVPCWLCLGYLGGGFAEDGCTGTGTGCGTTVEALTFATVGVEVAVVALALGWGWVTRSPRRRAVALCLALAAGPVLTFALSTVLDLATG